MDPQDPGPGKPQAPADQKQPAQAQRLADESANDSNWGVGSASALDNLRRHEYRARRSRPYDTPEPPSTDRPTSD